MVCLACGSASSDTNRFQPTAVRMEPTIRDTFRVVSSFFAALTSASANDTRETKLPQLAHSSAARCAIPHASRRRRRGARHESMVIERHWAVQATLFTKPLTVWLCECHKCNPDWQTTTLLQDEGTYRL